MKLFFFQVRMFSDLGCGSPVALVILRCFLFPSELQGREPSSCGMSDKGQVQQAVEEASRDKWSGSGDLALRLPTLSTRSLLSPLHGVPSFLSPSRGVVSGTNKGFQRQVTGVLTTPANQNGLLFHEFTFFRAALPNTSHFSSA